MSRSVQVFGLSLSRLGDSDHVGFLKHSEFVEAATFDVIIEAPKDGINKIGNRLVPSLPKLLNDALRNHGPTYLGPFIEIVLDGLQLRTKNICQLEGRACLARDLAFAITA